MKRFTIFLILAMAVLAGIGLGVKILGGDSRPTEKSGRMYRIDLRDRQQKRKMMLQKLKNGKITQKLVIAAKSQDVALSKEKPQAELSDEQEAALTELQRQLLMDIRAALDSNDRKALLKLVQRMQASDEWPDGIPVAIRRAAIQALGWFGSGCVPEIAGFLNDPEPEILNTALEQFQNALMDVTLSDREISAFLIAAAKTVTDRMAMDMMMMGLNSMRHSVAVSTMIAIMGSGNATAKTALPDGVSFYTCEDGLDTPEKLNAWLKENPDNEYDEEFYGGTSSGDSLL